MNILVVGCGKVGCGLANYLSHMGHDVCVVDNDPASFDMLDDDYAGMTVTGVPIDMDVLRRAGIEACDVVAAVTKDDNVNIMVSQLAKEIFNVNKVLTRIYNPKHKNVFSQFGLLTVCPTSLTVDVMQSIINEADEELKQVTFDNSVLSMVSVDCPRQYWGRPVSEIETDGGEQILGLLRLNGQISLIGHTAKGLELRPREGDKILFARQVE